MKLKICNMHFLYNINKCAITVATLVMYPDLFGFTNYIMKYEMFSKRYVKPNIALSN